MPRLVCGQDQVDMPRLVRGQDQIDMPRLVCGQDQVDMLRLIVMCRSSMGMEVKHDEGTD